MSPQKSDPLWIAFLYWTIALTSTEDYCY